MALFSHSTPSPLSQNYNRQDLDAFSIFSDLFPNDKPSTLDQQIKFHLICNEALGTVFCY